jgi:stalled ribosome rescue protein Dom34
MTHPHAVLWIDQHEAKIFHFDGESFDVAKIESAHRHVRRHPSVTAERSHPADEKHYYHDVARALEDAAEVLIVGPSTAKLAFIKHVHKHEHGLEGRIVGVETVDHPTDGQLVAYARRYFRAADRMR